MNQPTPLTRTQTRLRYRDGAKLKTYTTILTNLWKRSLERMKKYFEDEIRELMNPVSPPTTPPRTRLRSAEYWLESILVGGKDFEIGQVTRFHQSEIIRTPEIGSSKGRSRTPMSVAVMKTSVKAVLRTVCPPGKLHLPLPLNGIKIDTASIALDPADIYALMTSTPESTSRTPKCLSITER